jgi:Ca2+/H+ antiporter
VNAVELATTGHAQQSQPPHHVHQQQHPPLPFPNPQSDKMAGNTGAEDDEEEEEDVLGYKYALFWLAAITVLIAFLSEAISDSIQDASDQAGISAIFISAIVLPIVGNAAEHAGKGKQNGFVNYLITN